MFWRPTEVFGIPKAFYMVFLCFPLFGRKKELEHNHFYWIKFAVHERLSCSHLQVLTITSCALRVVLEERREGKISKNKWVFLTWIEKCACFLLNTTTLQQGWHSKHVLRRRYKPSPKEIHMKCILWSPRFVQIKL